MKQHACRALGVALLLCSGQSAADTLIGQNGDKIAGRFVEEKNDKIVFISDLFGRLEVSSAEASVEHEVVDDKSWLLLKQATQAAQEDAPSAAANAPHWSMDVGVKIDVDRGSLKTSEEKVDARLTTARQTRRGELHGKFAYKYKMTEGDLRDNDWLASRAYAGSCPRVASTQAGWR